MKQNSALSSDDKGIQLMIRHLRGAFKFGV